MKTQTKHADHDQSSHGNWARDVLDDLTERAGVDIPSIPFTGFNVTRATGIPMAPADVQKRALDGSAKRRPPAWVRDEEAGQNVPNPDYQERLLDDHVPVPFGLLPEFRDKVRRTQEDVSRQGVEKYLGMLDSETPAPALMAWDPETDLYLIDDGYHRVVAQVAAGMTLFEVLVPKESPWGVAMHGEVKHADHDQSSHGNWAKPTVVPKAKALGAWEDVAPAGMARTIFGADSAKKQVMEDLGSDLRDAMSEEQVEDGLRQMSNLMVGDLPEYSEDTHERVAAYLVQAWAAAANGGESSFIQSAVAARFGLVDKRPAFDAPDLVGEEDASLLLDTFVAAQYARTQEMFAEAGITHMPLYRGMVHADAGRMYPLSSWSASGNTATEFATANADAEFAYTGDAPDDDVENIISGAETGLLREVADDVEVYPGQWTGARFSAENPAYAEWEDAEPDEDDFDDEAAYTDAVDDWDMAQPDWESDVIVNAVVYRQDVPVERIFATPMTGLGCLHEDECVVLSGMPTQVKHMGPGPHPSGTPQSVHGGGRIPRVGGPRVSATWVEALRETLPTRWTDDDRAAVTEAIKGSQVWIRVPADVVYDIVELAEHTDDETASLRNQHETGRSEGFIDGDGRLRYAAETALFGYAPGGEGGPNHPVYGYVSSGGHGHPEVGFYGNIAFGFNDAVTERATVTFGDSLDDSGVSWHPAVMEARGISIGGDFDVRPKRAPTPLGEGFDPDIFLDHMYSPQDVHPDIPETMSKYVEAQVHGANPALTEVTDVYFDADDPYHMNAFLDALQHGLEEGPELDSLYRAVEDDYMADAATMLNNYFRAQGMTVHMEA